MSATVGGFESYRQRRLTEAYWPADLSRPLFEGTLGDALRDAAAAVPDRLAVVEGRALGEPFRTLTYAQLLAESERVAAALLSLFRPGERVAVCADNIPEWMPIFYGCAMAGIVLVTVNPACKARELRHILGKSGAAGLFIIDEYRGCDWREVAQPVQADLPALREIIRLADYDKFLDLGRPVAFPAVDPLDPCVIMFTSGTTGVQKGVMFHHKNVANMAYFTQERGGLTAEGVFVNPMPMFYIGGLGHVGVGAVMHRCTHVVVSHWDAHLYMALVERWKGTYSLLVPTMIEAVLAHPARPLHDLSSLSNLVSGASVVEAGLIERIRAQLGATICNIYGQTEMQGVVTATHRDDASEDQTSTIGQPIPHCEVKIADPETGAVMPLDTEGEIWVRGYQTMIGYFDMPEETARTLRPDGWLLSGDIGSMDARGFIKITGRIKDLIIRGGQNIYPREIETLLLEHPQVAAVAVVGIPDPFWGEQVGAVVIPASADGRLSPADLHAFCRENLSAFKVPSLWYSTTRFPFTETGKLQKFKLIDAIGSGALVAESAPEAKGRRQSLPAR